MTDTNTEVAEGGKGPAAASRWAAVKKLVKDACLWVARLVLYPLHAPLRVLARLALLCATVASILLGAALASLLVIVASVSIPNVAEWEIWSTMASWPILSPVARWALWDALRERLDSVIGDASLADFLTLLASLSVFGLLVTSFGKAAWKRWCELGEKIAESSAGKWFPPWEARTSVVETWRKYLAPMPMRAKESFVASGKLILLLAAAARS